MTEDDEFGAPDECQHEDTQVLRMLDGSKLTGCRACGATWTQEAK